MSFNDPTGCTVVVVGGEYINKFQAVMKELNRIGDQMKRIPEAVFVFLDGTYPEDIFSIELRHKHSPTTVNLLNSFTS